MLKKNPNQPIFRQGLWVCWEMCNTYLASLAGTTPKPQLSHWLVTEGEKEASTEKSHPQVSDTQTNHMSLVMVFFLPVSPPHPFLLCYNTQYSFQSLERFKSSTGSSGKITVLVASPGSNAPLDTCSTNNKCAWFLLMNHLILSDLNFHSGI